MLRGALEWQGPRNRPKGVLQENADNTEQVDMDQGLYARSIEAGVPQALY
jgi:hypothetical protein